MAGISAISSKLKHLNSVAIQSLKGQKISVVTYIDANNIKLPDNAADNILLVPKPCKTVDEWQQRYG